MKKSKKVIIKILVSVFVILAALLLIIFESSLYSSVSNSLTISAHTKPETMMVAHRGFSGVYPQNTMPAFEAAIENGFDGCEIDIHTTKDGKWVVIHNDTVDAMTDGEGEVKDMTLEEIRQLKIDSGNGIENHPDLKIPTLEEVLTLFSESDITPVIEIKDCDVKYLPDFKAMMDSFNLSKRSIIISFNKDYLTAYRELDKDIEMLFLAHAVTKEDVDWCVKNAIDGYNYYHKGLYKSIGGISYAKEKGLKIGSWTVDNTLYKDIMVLFGAEIITTNKITP